MGESIVYVWKHENDSTGVAQRKQIETGYSQDNRVEVTSGLTSGEELIVNGSRNLRDQQKVKINK